MGDVDRSKGLTQSELAAVLRRAAELDADQALPVPAERLDPALVEAAAIEVGLSPVSVRRAMNEVLHPDDTPPDLYTTGALLPSRQLVVAREVPGPVSAVEEQVSRFLRRQLFEQQRIFVDGSKWAPRRGWVASVRRGTDPGGRFILKEVRSVSVTIAPLAVPSTESGAPTATDESRVIVRLSLDLSSVRSIHTAWLTGGAVSGAAVLGGAGVAIGLDPLAVAALPVAGGLTVGGHYLGRWNVRREIDRIHTGLAGLLDRIEHPDRSAHPRRADRAPQRPAPSRRRGHDRSRPRPEESE